MNFKAMWQYKCPRCRSSGIFCEPFEISRPLDMPHHCQKCGQRFDPEPGFYFGAMFLSYIISGWLLLLPTLLLVFYFKWSVGSAIGLVILIAAMLYLRILRGSRSLWLHLNVKYDPNYESSEINS